MPLHIVPDLRQQSVRRAFFVAVLATLTSASAFLVPLLVSSSRGHFSGVLSRRPLYLLAMALLFARSAAWLDADRWHGAALACVLLTTGFITAVVSRTPVKLHITDVLWLAGVIVTARAAQVMRRDDAVRSQRL